MYRRSTRIAQLAGLPPQVTAALNTYADQHQLRLDGARVWITHSENPPAEGFFGKLFGSRANSLDPDAAHDTFIVLHPTHLVVATNGEKRGTLVTAAPLAMSSMVRGSAVAAKLAAMVPGADDGISVTGFPGGEHGQLGSHFIGLGKEPAAAECGAAIEAAITAAKNPR